MKHEYYRYRELPWISKSKVKAFEFFCPYLFYITHILKEKEDKLSKRADIGTDSHMIFSMFWRELDVEFLFNELVIDPVIPLEDNPVTLYFYGLCMTIIPEYDRDVLVLQRIFWKFALLHASRFLYLYQLFNGNNKKVWKYFRPVMNEDFYMNQDFEIYGTIDTAFIDINQDGREVLYIADYKTGNIPADVLKGRTHKLSEYTIKLPPKLMFEIHFYGLLVLLDKGWSFRDERVRRFVLYDEYEEDGEWKKFGLALTKKEHIKLNKRKKKYLTKIKPRLKKFDTMKARVVEIEHGDLELGIIFLSGNKEIKEPVVVKKPLNYTSVTTVLVKINNLRQAWYYRNYDEYYLVREMKNQPEYSIYRCPLCSRNEKCLEAITEKIAKKDVV